MTAENKTVDITTENVKAGALDAFLARPSTGENLPCVIIIHEIFGLNDNIREIARRFAREGFVALAVDLFSHGNRALCITRVVFNMMRNPLKSFSMYDLDGTAQFLQAQPGIDPTQLGVIGFCMGGGYALAFAVHSDQLRAASIFYGRNPSPIESLERACPVVGSYGATDKMFSKQGLKMQETMQKFGRPVDVKIYPNVGHSFFNQGDKEVNREAAADAWKRTLDWFHQYLPQKA
ncbi:MAG TPA: dienelactone hydrolase family protein [Chloroflexia bacterium]|nr:dienelactone hydrolase family protein [Chloroflexia bacterium]